MIACALALSAAIPSFSQTKKGGALAHEQRVDVSAGVADAAAGDALPNGHRSGKLRVQARSRTPLADGTRRPEAHPSPTLAAVDATAITRDFAALRARLGLFLDARFATALVDAAQLSAAPAAVDRGQLMRASLAGNLRASYWLLQHPELLLGPEAAAAYRSSTFSPGEAERALRLALYHRLILQAGSVEVLQAFDLLGHTADDLAAGWLAADAALRVYYELEANSFATPLARAARLARAFLLAEHGRGIGYLEGQAARLFASLLGDPQADIAGAAADALWRLQNLRVGCLAPTLCGNDVVGNELCLQDFRGRVVLVRFWSFDDVDAEGVLEQDANLDRIFWDHPFSVLGVNRDSDREFYLQLAEQRGLPGNQVYEGPTGENLLAEIRDRRAGRPPAFDAWREARSGSSYLIDTRGVIRAVDPPLARLPELIQGLVDERYHEKRVLGF